MYQSILQFIEKDIIEVEKIMGKILTGEKDADDFSQEVVTRLNSLACRWISEMYEKLDETIRESVARKKKWNIEQRNEPKELLDIAGTLRFTRTGYEDKRTGKYIYLLDKILGIDGHQRITLSAAAKILEEKKKLRYLHIVADEDHVSAQFWNVKGDLQKSEKGNKINTIISKVIVVYEDVVNESGEQSKNPRYRLVGKKTFSGVHKGEAENYRFWEKVRDYIVKTYDMDVLERVYIAGDGGAWIKAGTEIIENSRFVLDKYHMMKYINTSVAHLLDSADDVKSEIWGQ